MGAEATYRVKMFHRLIQEVDLKHCRGGEGRDDHIRHLQHPPRAARSVGPVQRRQ